jgi:hypothetical protein
MIRAVVLGAASMISLPVFLTAQGVKGPTPLEVTVTPAQKQVIDTNTRSTIWVPGADLTIKNVSGRCVIAYSLKMEWKNSDGQIIVTGGETRFRHNKAQFTCLDPGQSLGREGGPLRVPLDASGNPATASVTVDFVIFGDGSNWGPGNDAEQKGFLLGKYWAYKQLQSQKDE